MLPGEEHAADVPAGYTLISHPRKPLLNNSRRGDGIALIIRDSFVSIWPGSSAMESRHFSYRSAFL